MSASRARLRSDEEAEIRVLGPSDNFGLDEQATRELSVAAPPGGNERGSRALRRRSSASRVSYAGSSFENGWQKSYLMGRVSRESARAITYCDVSAQAYSRSPRACPLSLDHFSVCRPRSALQVVSLSVPDLASILHKDRDLQSKTNCASNDSSDSGAMGRTVKFLAKLCKARKSVSMGGKTGDLAEMSTPGGGWGAALRGINKMREEAAESAPAPTEPGGRAISIGFAPAPAEGGAPAPANSRGASPQSILRRCKSAPRASLTSSSSKAKAGGDGHLPGLTRV